MANNKFEEALAGLDVEKRALLKRIVAGAAFAVPTIASFAVSDLAAGPIGSCLTLTVTAVATSLSTFTSTQTTTIVTITTTFTTTTTTITSPVSPTAPVPG